MDSRRCGAVYSPGGKGDSELNLRLLDGSGTVQGKRTEATSRAVGASHLAKPEASMKVMPAVGVAADGGSEAKRTALQNVAAGGDARRREYG